jgi:hypothetical protein
MEQLVDSYQEALPKRPQDLTREQMALQLSRWTTWYAHGSDAYMKMFDRKEPDFLMQHADRDVQRHIVQTRALLACSTVAELRKMISQVFYTFVGIISEKGDCSELQGLPIEEVHDLTKCDGNLADRTILYKRLHLAFIMLNEMIVDRYNTKAHVEVRPSPIHGKGVFATKAIDQFQVVDAYGFSGFEFLYTDGYGVAKETFSMNKEYQCDFDPVYCLSSTASWTCNGEHFFVRQYGDPTDFEHGVGHMCNSDPEKCNAALFPILNYYVVIAIKKIEVGEEILVFYGDTYTH